MNTFLPLTHATQSRLAAICRANAVRGLYLFGSALTERFDQKHASDLDFYVEMEAPLPPLERGENLLRLWNELESLFGRPVDLLTDTAVQNPFLLRQINSTKVLLYDGTSQEILV